MRFSVIIPFYNRQDLVSGVLDSVCAQGEHDFEIIVIDDGSTDGTWEQLRAHPAPAVRIRTANQGPALARNEAASHAHGEYLAFLDSDDLWFPYTLAVYREAIMAHGHPSVVTGTPLLFTDSPPPPPPAPGAPVTEAFPCYYAAWDAWRWFGVSSFVIRREAFARVGGFAARRINAEDADLMLRLGTEPGFVHVLQPPTFAYRRHAANLTKDFHLGYAGAVHLIDSEKAGRYPGDGRHVRQRRRILTRHIRPVILAALRAREPLKGWHLYRRSFGWNLREGRLRFLAYAGLRLASGMLVGG